MMADNQIGYINYEIAMYKPELYVLICVYTPLKC